MSKSLKLKLLLALLLCGSVYAQQRDAYVAIGDIYCSDGSIVTPEAYPNSGKTGKGVVCYVDASGEHGWVLYYKQSPSNQKWSTEYIKTGVPIKKNIRDFNNSADGLIKDCNGKANTEKIIAISNYGTKYPAFKYAVDLEGGWVLGDGWYVPAAGQLNYMIAYAPVLNASLALINYSDPIMWKDESTYTYWASDEATNTGNNMAWYLKNDCSFATANKTTSRRVRAFRNF